MRHPALMNEADALVVMIHACHGVHEAARVRTQLDKLRAARSQTLKTALDEAVRDQDAMALAEAILAVRGEHSRRVNKDRHGKLTRDLLRFIKGL